MIIEVHGLGWLADLLGAHELGPWPASFQARHSCRDCWWHTTCWCAKLAPGARELNAKRAHATGCRSRVCRTREELQRDQAFIGGPFRTKQLRTEAMRDRGISRQHCVRAARTKLTPPTLTPHPTTASPSHVKAIPPHDFGQISCLW